MSLLPYASLTHRRRAYRSTADVVLLSTQVASGSASITFSSDITSAYGEYIFRWYNFKPNANNVALQFGINATDGADYNDSPITSTFFQCEHRENDDDQAVNYQTSLDRAAASLVQTLDMAVGDGADESGCGVLQIFNPSNTTYVKQFFAQSHVYHTSDYPKRGFIAGYIDDTTAIDDVKFQPGSGTMDGTFKMWGVK